MSILLLLFLISINAFCSVPTLADENGSKAMRLNMYHRLDNLRDMIESHNGHTLRLTKRVAKKRNATEFHDVEMSLISGSYAGNAEYLVTFQVGTPPQQFSLIPDTGSDLAWIMCEDDLDECHDCKRENPHGHNSHGGRLFRAYHSSTFKPISCSADVCIYEFPFALALCPNSTTPCSYDYLYVDQSSAQGFYANETVTINHSNGREESIEHVPIGCTKSSGGKAFKGADGVLGLSSHPHSFATRAMDKFGRRFAYCLVDHWSPKSKSSFLVFGKQEYPERANMNHTKLVIGKLENFYALNMIGISIGNEILKIPMTVWDLDKKGGTIMDSGTSLTVLARPAYDLVITRLKSALLGFTRVFDIDPFEFCFNTTGYHESKVPKLVFHFEDGARFEPHVKSYVIEVIDGVRCLGFTPASFPGLTIIGNIMQQNFLWEYDLIDQKLRFSPSTCD